MYRPCPWGLTLSGLCVFWRVKMEMFIFWKYTQNGKKIFEKIQNFTQNAKIILALPWQPKWRKTWIPCRSKCTWRKRVQRMWLFSIAERNRSFCLVGWPLQSQVHSTLPMSMQNMLKMYIKPEMRRKAEKTQNAKNMQNIIRTGARPRLRFDTWVMTHVLSKSLFANNFGHLR